MIDTLRDLARPLPLLLPSDITGMRRVAGLSMRALARRMGVSVQTLSEWERGADTPARQHVYRLLGELMDAQREASAIRTRARRLRQPSTELLGQNPHKSLS